MFDVWVCAYIYIYIYIYMNVYVTDKIAVHRVGGWVWVDVVLFILFHYGFFV